MSEIATYLEEVGRRPILTPAEVDELVRQRDAGDPTAAGRIAAGNLPLVIHVCKWYRHEGWRLDDLIGEGNVGLLRAAQKYTTARGTRFSTYATYWIRQAVQRYLASDTTVRVPVYQSRPEPGAGAGARFRDAAERAWHTASLDAADLAAGLAAPEPDPDAADPGVARDRAAALHAALRRIPQREADVVRLRAGLDANGEPLTLKEVGERLGGLSRERVRQIEGDGLSRLYRDRRLRRLVRATA